MITRAQAAIIMSMHGNAEEAFAASAGWIVARRVAIAVLIVATFVAFNS